MEKFARRLSSIDRLEMKTRIARTCRELGWQSLVGRLLKPGVSAGDLRVAEVGCGTGTFSLTLNFLGMNTTLIDADEEALMVAKKTYAMYHRTAALVQADVVRPVPPALKNRFDVVLSRGLAEHFKGRERAKCFSFHKELLGEHGIACISVPNRLSVSYQAVRMLRQATGTWRIALEQPFTYWELMRCARNAGFSGSGVIGNLPLLQDMREHAFGLASAVLDVLPARVRRMLHRVFRSGQHAAGRDEECIVLDAAERAQKRQPPSRGRSLKDYLSAGIVLFGYADKRFS